MSYLTDMSIYHSVLLGHSITVRRVRMCGAAAWSLCWQLWRPHLGWLGSTIVMEKKGVHNANKKICPQQTNWLPYPHPRWKWPSHRGWGNQRGILSEPSGVAAGWVSNAVLLSITCGVQHVLLSMLHARTEWCQYEWRVRLSSPQAKALPKVNEALLALLPRDWSFCKEGGRVSLASTLFAIPNRKKTKAGPNMTWAKDAPAQGFAQSAT